MTSATSDIVVTDALGVPKEEEAQAADAPFSFEDPRVSAAVPEPQGYQILVAPVTPEETTDSGLYKPQQALENERVSAVVGTVVRMGPDCYKDEERFPHGPYCDVGDWVIFHAYSGTRIMVFGQEFRLIADETVKAKVSDPRGIVRA